jgi:hypothetical protein
MKAMKLVLVKASKMMSDIHEMYTILWDRMSVESRQLIRSVPASKIKSTGQVVKTCNACLVKSHLAAQCPNNSNNDLSRTSLVTNNRWECQQLIKRLRIAAQGLSFR